MDTVETFLLVWAGLGFVAAQAWVAFSDLGSFKGKKLWAYVLLSGPVGWMTLVFFVLMSRNDLRR